MPDPCRIERPSATNTISCPHTGVGAATEEAASLLPLAAKLRRPIAYHTVETETTGPAGVHGSFIHLLTGILRTW